MTRPPVFDPAGVVTTRYLVGTAIPESVPNRVSVGVMMSKTPVQRVPWPDHPYSAGLVALRLAGPLFVIPPLAAAVRVFDRFDPGRWRPRERDAERPPSVSLAGAGASLPSEALPQALSQAFFPASLRPFVASPRLSAAILAEARLVWDLASWLKWPLLLAALLAAVVPAAASAFLLLLAPVISEVAPREALAGTRALVFSQPSVPRRTVLWKGAAVALFVLGFGAPGMLRAFVTSTAHGIALATGLLFVAAFAVGAGSLTGGGKLFTALYTALWYVSLSGSAGALDYCGVAGNGLDLGVRLTYLGLSATILGAALVVEQIRRRA